MVIDRTTKANIFTSEQFGSNWGIPVINWKLIGFRPLLNNGAAFSSLLGKYAFLQSMGLIICIMTSLLIFIKIEIKFLIPLLFIGAGALGNTIDRFIYDGYVRDILYFPWWPSYATFNFADSFIIVNSVTLLIIILIDLIKNTNSGRGSFA